MCGISGIWNLNGKRLQHEDLRSFNDTLTHRGPDDSGYFMSTSEAIGMGHRRLSILDLSSDGQQPMSYENGRYHISYNGEIYNFLELKQELEGLGHTFRTKTDTEVVIASFAHWGKDCLQKFNGMWAFAIWDEQKKELFLSRDRFGIKPLYYTFNRQNQFAFASETTAFQKLVGFEKTINSNHLRRSISDHSSIEAFGQTIYNGIFQLKPGHSLSINKEKKIEITQWWKTHEHLPEIPSKYEDQVAEFQRLFRDSCKLRMRSDVSLASALSGGLDSSSVYCTLNDLKKESSQLDRLPPNWQKAFVGIFPGTQVDEQKYAEEVIKYTHGEAQYVPPNYSNLVEDIESSTRQFDGISGTPIICLTNIYQAMRADGITVSLDGHGVDEMMYGYRNSVQKAIFASLGSANSRIQDLKTTYLDLLFDNERVQQEQIMNAVGNDGSVKNFLRRLKRTFQKENSPKLKSHPWLTDQDQWDHPYDQSWNNFGLESIPHDQFHVSELPYNLRDFDRGSMQHSIEIRMPFMDYRLVSYVFALPQESKIGGGFTKRILRDSMKGIMPESIRNRKLKIGLGSPLKEWFNGALNQYLLDTVHSQSFLINEIWNGHAVSDFVETKCKEKSWDDSSSSSFWPILNAHLIMTQNQ